MSFRDAQIAYDNQVPDWYDQDDEDEIDDEQEEEEE